MDDGKMIKEYNISEKDFVVLTIKPTKVSNPPKVQQQTNTQNQQTNQNTQQTQNTTQTQPQQTQNTTQTQTQQTQNRPQTQTQQESQEPPEEMINNVTSMGFPRDEVIRALKMSRNNPALAVDILTGVSVGNDNFDDQGEQDDPQQGGGNVFATLRNHPLFVQMRALVQANPQYLEELLGNIANQSPQLFQVIQQHQDQFVQFLNEPVTQEQLQQALAQGLGLQGQGGQIPRGQQQLGGQGGGQIPQGQQQLGGQGGGQPQRIEVHLTQEENEAVNNLVGMGFNRDKVIHYYILFEKDQEMTANYLLNHGFEKNKKDK